MEPDAAPPDDPLAPLHPHVAAWFRATHRAPTPPQVAALEAHHAGEHALVVSPTGTGKTLAAFLGILSDLHRLAAQGELADGIQCLYVSPLRALNTDVARNLQGPLDEIARRIRDAGQVAPSLRVEVRTGDTPTAQRRAQAVAPPHVLATTPETLAILLNAPRMSLALAKVRHVILDEVHAMAGTKRGAHLTLSLERLERLVVRAGRPPPVRVGLSGTVPDPAQVARFLVGNGRACRLVETPVPRGLELDVVAAVADIDTTTPEEYQASLLSLIHERIQAHRTTIVFTQTRRAAEQVVEGLRQRYDAYTHALEDTDSTDPAYVAPDTSDALAPHHGSMSREARELVELRLQRGEARCVVASSSLELGIDVGSIDHVVLLGSPRDPARTLQRIGRSGHRIDATRRATLVALDPDDHAECLALAEAVRSGTLAPLPPTPAALDVLAQHLMGLALERPLHDDDALAPARRAAPYADLEPETLDEVVDALWQGGLLARDSRGRIAPGSRLSRRRYALNVGTIDAGRRVRIRHGERYVGEVDEAFAEQLSPGDVFQLAGDSWRFDRIQGGTAWASPAPGQVATLPRWSGESVPLSKALAEQTARIRAQQELCRPNNDVAFTESHGAAPLSQQKLLNNATPVIRVSESAVGVLSRAQQEWAGETDPDEWMVEASTDEEGRHVTLFHVPAGRRANEALARTLALVIADEQEENVMQVLVDDLGFALVAPRGAPSPRAALVRLASRTDAEVDAWLAQAARRSMRFRRRLHSVLDRFFLTRAPDDRPAPGEAAARLRTHLDDPHSPAHREALREVLEDAWDGEGAKRILARLRSGERRLGKTRTLPAPSPFAFRILYKGDAPPSAEHVRARREAHERREDVRAFAEAAARRRATLDARREI